VLGGALPASAVSAAHPAAHAAVSAAAAAPSGSATADTSPGYYTATVTLGACSESGTLEFYYSSYGYWNIKITMTTVEDCSVGGYWTWQAAATCSGYNVWGSSVIAAGDYTIASCDSSHPTFQHGGWRTYIDGTWYYWTYKISPA